MHQKIRNQEDNITTSPPLTKQHQREKTLDVLTQKEQQEQSEIEEGIEIHVEGSTD